MHIQPYLFFDGRCEEALEFYKKALGAQVTMMMRMKEGPPEHQTGMPPNSGEKIMHAAFRVGDSVVLVSDGRCTGRPEFKGFSISLTVPTPAEADRTFQALVEGGTVCMPLSETFFSPRFGMVQDRFGVMWMLIVQK